MAGANIIQFFCLSVSLAGAIILNRARKLPPFQKKLLLYSDLSPKVGFF